MSDEYSAFVGRCKIPSASFQNWHFLVNSMFSDMDFRCKPRRSLPASIRSTYDYLYRNEKPKDGQYKYLISSAIHVRKRLQIQGVTDDQVRGKWEEARRDEIALYKELDLNYTPEQKAEMAKVERITFDQWLVVINAWYNSTDEAILKRFRCSHAVALLDKLNDVLIELAVLTMAFPAEPVWMDCNDLYVYDDDNRTPHSMSEEEDPEHYESAGKIILLTEGKSDTRIMRTALNRFYPEFSGLYSFIDFDEFRIEGGASPLSRMIKALAGAGMKNRMIGIFDNDAAGLEAYETLRSVRFPDNVRLMMLPDTKLARNYPTLGPGGLLRMDVNRAGAPIELYLGRSSLSDASGQLYPIRWSQWQQNVLRYQGVIQNKDAISEKFIRSLPTMSAAKLRTRYPEMDLLLRTIFSAFERQETHLS